eukprot:Rmarinus@m.28362
MKNTTLLFLLFIWLVSANSRVFLASRTIEIFGQQESESHVTEISSTWSQFLVTFTGPLSFTTQLAFMLLLESVPGSMLLSYIPEHTYVIWTHASATSIVLEFPGVLSVMEYFGADKVSSGISNFQPGIMDSLIRDPVEISTLLHRHALRSRSSLSWTCDSVSEADGTFLYVVLPTHPSSPPPLLRGTSTPGWSSVALAEAWGSAVGSLALVCPVSATKLKVFISDPEDVTLVVSFLASQPEAHFIEEVPRHHTMNRYAVGVLQSGDALSYVLHDHGLTGEGQIIGVADTGVDTDHCFFHDPNYAIPFDGLNLNHRKVIQYNRIVDGEDAHGHGTHVGGSVAGSVYDSASADGAENYEGAAPDARLVIDDIGYGVEGTLVVPDSIYEDLFPLSYAAGARIHSNSWGADQNTYDSLSSEVDAYMFDHPDFLLLFAAGNSGVSGLGSVGTPGVAKNCITVGATHNTEESWDDVYDTTLSSYTVYSEETVASFSSRGPTSDDRYKPDVMAPGYWVQSATSDNDLTSYQCGTDDSQYVEVFSGEATGKYTIAVADFGPSTWYLEDLEAAVASPSNGCSSISGVSGRIALIYRGTCYFDEKVSYAQAAGAVAVIVINNVADPPTVVMSSSGTVSVSIPAAMVTMADGATLVDALPLSNLKYVSQPPGIVENAGTSMATPLVSGSAALVRQYFTDGYYPTGEAVAENAFTPSAALVKAVVVQSGVAMTGYIDYYGWGMYGVLDSDVPNNYQGHGRSRLHDVLPFADDASGNSLFVSDGQAVVTDQRDTYCFDLLGTGTVKFTLVYTDYPSTPSASVHLVNDIDLTVSLSSGEMHLGNDKDGTGSPDSLNNVERVVLDPSAGSCVVYVDARTIPMGPQPYALVVSGQVQESSVCSCPAGYAGEASGLQCFEADECASSTHNCDVVSTCTDTDGSFYCSCPVNYWGSGSSECTACATYAGSEAGSVSSEECVCNSGYTGDGSTSCSDLNECTTASHNCDNGASCENSFGSFSCTCGAGYWGDGTTCTACASNGDSAAGSTQASDCSCNVGFSGDGHTTCIDIDECEVSAHNCSPNADCIDTSGSFSCSCSSDFFGDGLECTPCASNGGSPAGSFSPSDCSCNEGYEGDGFETCEDVDECSTSASACDDMGSQCFNTEGSYSCSCLSGYYGDGLNCSPCAVHATSPDHSSESSGCTCNDGYSGDGHSSCADINECETANNCNTMHAQCANGDGSYFCTCNAGFYGDGVSCTACATEASSPEGSFTEEDCSCNVGYAGDGHSSCTDTNECLQSTHDCDLSAVCSNVDGSFQCACEAGHYGDGVVCVACAQEGSSAPASTANTDCSCNLGYTGDGHTICSDVDECESGNNNCHELANCSNVPGSFACSCTGNYVGNGVDCADVLTEPPVVLVPRDGDVLPINFRVEFALPESALNGSVRLHFHSNLTQDSTGSRELVLHDSLALEGFHSFLIPALTNVSESLVVSANPPVDLVHGVLYNMSLSYRDVWNNTAAVDTVVGVSVDSFLVAPLLLSPISKQVLAHEFLIQVQLFESAAAGTVKIEILSLPYPLIEGDLSQFVVDSVTPRRTVVFNGTWEEIGVHGLYLSDMSVANNSNYIASIEPAVDLMHLGLYAFVLHMTDQFGNQVADMAARDVIYDAYTELPEIVAPFSHSFVYNSSVFSFLLPESAGTVELRQWPPPDSLTGVVELDGFEASGIHNITFQQLLSFGLWLENNHTYDFEIRYRDAAGNAASSAVVSNVTFDVNECEQGTHDCSAHASCVNTVGGYSCFCFDNFYGSGVNCSQCPSSSWSESGSLMIGDCLCSEGYVKEEHSCVDFDECTMSVHNCETNATCTNTQGSFSCSCDAGWYGSEIECNACGGNATSLAGSTASVNCTCITGFDGDASIQCFDANECLSQLDSCAENEICENTVGSFQCRCASGFGAVNGTCVDSNECEIGSHTCSGEMDCVNTVGSFSCDCSAGYIAVDQSCVDTDECLEFTSNCDLDHSLCENTNGSFVCSCLGGFIGDGVTCSDYDECSEGTHNCDYAASCLNSNGSFVCECQAGYEGNGTVCTICDPSTYALASECVVCPANSTSLSGAASHLDCYCQPGYEGPPGHACTACPSGTFGVGGSPNMTSVCESCPANSTAPVASGSASACECLSGHWNTSSGCDPCPAGTYLNETHPTCTPCPEHSWAPEASTDVAMCLCLPGFNSTTDGLEQFCEDIDECSNDPCSVNANCTNTAGSFLCVCLDGFVGDGMDCRDAVTQPPTIFAPGDNDLIGIVFQVDFSLPEDSCELCVSIVLYCDDCVSKETGEEDMFGPRVLTLAGDVSVAGMHTVHVLPLQNATLSDEVIAVEPPVNLFHSVIYNLRIQYSDVWNNSLAAAEVSNLYLDAYSTSPALIRPATGGSVPQEIVCEFHTFEQASSVYLEITWTAGSFDPIESRSLDLEGDDWEPGRYTFVINATGIIQQHPIVPSDFVPLVDGGVYTFRLFVSDVVGNDAVSASSRNVTFDAQTEAPQILSPNTTSLTATTPITFRLPEAALNSTVQLEFHLADVVAGLMLPPMLPCDSFTSASTTCAPHMSWSSSRLVEFPFVDRQVRQETTVDNILISFLGLASAGVYTVTIVHNATEYLDFFRDQSEYTMVLSYADIVGNAVSSVATSVIYDLDECDLALDTCASNHGNCANSAGSFSCSCEIGYSGSGIECHDVQECVDGTHNCATDALCTNTDGSFTCSCLSGYNGSGVECIDVEECIEGIHDCGEFASCSNVYGSFSCSCISGYVGSGVNCSDLNECVEGTHDCNIYAPCNNTEGSFTCACVSGFTGSGIDCIDLEECSSGNHNCDTFASCFNSAGSFMCSCMSGFSGSGVLCNDIEECVEGIHDCNAYASCNNTAGSFTCSCMSGYIGSGVVCTDLDECANGVHDCSVYATCNNTLGSFTCSCVSGYIESGVECVDVEECFEGTHNCDTFAACNNTAGSFACSCLSGYAGSGELCNDVDECVEGAHDCALTALCVNTVGSYTCGCIGGYSGTGVACVDVEECLQGFHDCAATALCENTDGSFACVCETGYNGSGVECVDVEECAEGNHDCATTALCENTEGSFTCACEVGYSGTGVVCDDVEECQEG